jgi:hypothetical protein
MPFRLLMPHREGNRAAAGTVRGKNQPLFIKLYQLLILQHYLLPLIIP